MRLAVSNLAFAGSGLDETLSALNSLRVDGIEVAPSILWPGWAGATDEALREVRDQIHRAGLGCPSLQSLLYGRPELQLFGGEESRSQLRDHLLDVGRMAAGLGASTMVLGSPKNRLRGELDDADAQALAAEFLRDVGDALVGSGLAGSVLDGSGLVGSALALTLEPNPREYGADFLTGLAETADFVRRVDSPGVRLQLDTSSIILNQEDPTELLPDVIDLVAHVHVSEPFLGDFSDPSPLHRSIARALRDAGWSGWVSLEMRRPDAGLGAIEHAVDFVRATYVGTP